jgi:hypothetical protein
MFQRSSRFLPICLLTGALTIAGCSHKYSADDASLDPTGVAGELVGALPDDGATDARLGRLFFPLAVGNRWEYRVRARSTITTDAGPQPPVTEESTVLEEITGTRQVGDRTYFVELESLFRPGQATLGSEFLLRESRFGLFEKDEQAGISGAMVEVASDASVPPSLAAYVDRTVQDARARVAFDRAAAQVAEKVAAIQHSLHGLRRLPRGVDPGEITVLSFPLHLGARWIVRDDPRFVRSVVAHERVNAPLGLFPAWKLRGTAELFGPSDRVHFWYSNVGLVRIRFHVTGNAVDDRGNVIGSVVFDSDQSLSALSLERQHALADAPLP